MLHDDVTTVDEPLAPYVALPPVETEEQADEGEPTLRSVSTLAAMRSTPDTLAWLANQARNPSQDWTNMCESLARQARAIPAHYSSAELHAKAIPAGFRYGHETPSDGDIVLYLNGGYGHIATCDPQPGKPWAAWSNDYGGRGKVSLVTDLRDMARWCGASSWYIADAWWSSSTFMRTHNEEDDMALSEDDVKRIADAVWARQFKEYVDENGNGTRDLRTTADILLATHKFAFRAAEVPGAPGTVAEHTHKPGGVST